MLLALLELSIVVVNAAPLTLENEWTAEVIPITRSPVTTHQVRKATKIEPFQKWWNLIASSYPKRSWTTAKYIPLYSTFSGFSYSSMDFGKNYNGRNPHDEKKIGKNKHEKNKGGKNCYDKHCGKNLHREHCNKNQYDKPFGKNRHEKHCAKNRNSDGCHGKNYHEQNKLQKMEKCKKRKEFIMDNKVSFIYIIYFFYKSLKLISGGAKLYTNTYEEIINVLLLKYIFELIFLYICEVVLGF